jgi:hypothetical protein
VHRAGEPIQIGDTTFQYRGLVSAPEGFYASFDASRGSLAGASVLVGGTVFELETSPDGYRAGPIAPGSLSQDGLLTVRIADALIPFEAGLLP